jgi:hypothetical protein
MQSFEGTPTREPVVKGMAATIAVHVGRISALLSASYLCMACGMTQAREIEGAWELVSYELNGREVPVSGVVVFNDGEFGMIYSMGHGQRAESGRAHWGTYEIRGGRVEFDVRLWVQKAEESTGVVPGKAVGADLEWSDEGVTLRLEGGSVQQLRPIEAEGGELPSGIWKPEGTEVPAALVVSDRRYVLLRLDAAAREGAGYGGAVLADGTGRADWAISVDGESGTVAVGKGVPILKFSKVDGSVEFHDDDGTVLTFAKR